MLKTNPELIQVNKITGDMIEEVIEKGWCIGIIQVTVQGHKITSIRKTVEEVTPLKHKVDL